MNPPPVPDEVRLGDGAAIALASDGLVCAGHGHIMEARNLERTDVPGYSRLGDFEVATDLRGQEVVDLAVTQDC